MQYKIPRGTYDILPSDSWRWQKVINTFRATAQAFGYAEIVTPIFEQVELFERSSGESSDIVQKEMYRFEDKKGRTFALRPEGTAPVVRSFAENHLEAQSKINKLYYIGPMFRYDRPQAGRFRQFYQYGMECIGSHHPFYDAEIIALQKSFLNAVGLKQIELEINSVGCPNCSKDYDNALIKYFEPHREELCPDCQARIKLKPRRLLDCKVLQCKAVAVNAPSMLDFLDEDCKSHFEQVKGYLKEMSIDYTVNPRIVRGLDYYTHTAFEFLNHALGAQNAISGGGRYNGLIKQIGGMDIPAVGIAGGFERLLLSLDKEGLVPGEKPVPKAYLVTVGEIAVKQGIKLINTMRQQGISIAWDPEKETFKAQIKSADSCKAEFAIIIGEDEVASGKLTIKDMKTGSQSQYSETEACSLLLTS